MNYKIEIKNIENGWVMEVCRQSPSSFIPETATQLHGADEIKVMFFKTIQELAATLQRRLD